MKRLVVMFLVSSMLFAASKSAPPAPPMLPGMKVTKNSPLPKSCQQLPPLLTKLPPPLEVDLQRCKNELNMPTLKNATKIFGKGVVKVEPTKNFDMLYTVIVKKNKTVKKFYCNKSLKFCFDKDPKSYLFKKK